MDDSSVAFIGGGNMARSLIGGLIAGGRAPASIRVAEPVDALRAALAADFGVVVHPVATAAADGAGTWVLAVKPQVMAAVCESLAPSAAAGAVACTATPKSAASAVRSASTGSATRIDAGARPPAIRPPTRLRAMLPPPMNATEESFIAAV